MVEFPGLRGVHPGIVPGTHWYGFLFQNNKEVIQAGKKKSFSAIVTVIMNVLQFKPPAWTGIFGRISGLLLGRCVMVAQQSWELPVLVRIQAPQPDWLL